MSKRPLPVPHPLPWYVKRTVERGPVTDTVHYVVLDAHDKAMATCDERDVADFIAGNPPPPCRDCKGTGRASTDTGTGTGGGAAAVDPCVNHQHLACLGPGADNPLCVMKCARDMGHREP